MENQLITVYITAPRDRAEEIASPLVHEHLAACVNIVPQIRSIYSWKGQVCADDEALLICKTRADLFEALRERVTQLHPYEVPEVIALPIAQGHRPYLDWVLENTRGPRG